MYLPNLKSVALPIPETTAIEIMGGVVNPKSWGRRGRRGWGTIPFERVLISSYRPSTVTFPLFLRVLEISPFFCSSTSLIPTQPFVSPKFPHVPLGVGGWPLGHEERSIGLIVRAISSQDFQLMWSWSTNVTDRRTDGRTDRRTDRWMAFGPRRAKCWAYCPCN